MRTAFNARPPVLRRSASSQRIPSLLSCFLLLFGVKLVLRCFGLSRTLTWLHKRAARTLSGPAADSAFPARTAYRIGLAGALYPGRARCLEQSLALSFLLWRAGIPARFRVGVQPHPFAAHAWVEYLGQPLNDSLEHVRWFTPIGALPQ